MPSSFFTFLWTTPASANCALSPVGSASPRLRSSVARRPTDCAQETSFALAPVAWESSPATPAWNFSHTRGTPKNSVGRTSLRFSRSTSIDSAK